MSSDETKQSIKIKKNRFEKKTDNKLSAKPSGTAKPLHRKRR